MARTVQSDTREDRLVMVVRFVRLLQIAWAVSIACVCGIFIFSSGYTIPMITIKATPFTNGVHIYVDNVATTPVNPGPGFTSALSAYQPELDAVCTQSALTDWQYPIFGNKLTINVVNPAAPFLQSDEFPTGRYIPLFTVVFAYFVIVACIEAMLLVQTFLYGDSWMPSLYAKAGSDDVDWYTKSIRMSGYNWLRKLKTTTSYIMGMVAILGAIGDNTEIGIGMATLSMFWICMGYIVIDKLLFFCSEYVAPGKNEQGNSVAGTALKSNAKMYFAILMVAVVSTCTLHLGFTSFLIAESTNFTFPVFTEVTNYGVFLDSPNKLLAYIVEIAMILHAVGFFLIYMFNIQKLFNGNFYLAEFSTNTEANEHNNTSKWWNTHGKYNVDLMTSFVNVAYNVTYGGVIIALLNNNNMGNISNLVC
jgi:hypothetical protein